MNLGSHLMVEGRLRHQVLGPQAVLQIPSTLGSMLGALLEEGSRSWELRGPPPDSFPVSVPICPVRNVEPRPVRRGAG